VVLNWVTAMKSQLTPTTLRFLAELGRKTSSFSAMFRREQGGCSDHEHEDRFVNAAAWSSRKQISFLIRQGFDLLNYQGARTTPLKELTAGSNLLPCERQQLFVLPGRRRGVRDRPVDGTVVR